MGNVNAVSEGDAEPVEVEWCSPLGDGQYTDEAGTRWRLRGGGLPWRRLERLVKDQQVRVLHAYGNELRDVQPEEREGFVGRIRPYLDGKRAEDQRAADDHTDFRVGEFKDDRRRSLVVVEESC